ncbi:MAG: cytochrome c1 [SAR86 cluster bacterium]|uniref:Cytochrome c1 n=1 Tax=SAR86 cluster bacterium TaxID=2030880 RepID=A0A937IAV6_9GAMM|nr:cytochrome c1 [SAR86 cluster bacterium]
MIRGLIFLLLTFFSGKLLPAGESECGSLESCLEYKADVHDLYSLQRGLGVYMNYCSSCHSLQYLRWNRLQRDLDIPETILQDDLILNPEIKSSDYMIFGLNEGDSTAWLGASAPDLTLRTRVRGESWVYTYLKSFYEDASRPLGSNNLVLQGSSMPHVLASIQGNQKLSDKGSLVKVSEGSLTDEQFDNSMKDLVNFLAYAAEPIRRDRERNGIFVILFFVIFTAVMWLLNREYSKDIK